MTKYDGWEGRGGGGFTNIMYHEIAENILNKKVMEVARQAQQKKEQKNNGTRSLHSRKSES